MIIERNCPKCDHTMKLSQIIEWGVSKKYDKVWQCNSRSCKLKVTEKGVTE